MENKYLTKVAGILDRFTKYTPEANLGGGPLSRGVEHAKALFSQAKTSGTGSKAQQAYADLHTKFQQASKAEEAFHSRTRALYTQHSLHAAEHKTHLQNMKKARKDKNLIGYETSEHYARYHKGKMDEIMDAIRSRHASPEAGYTRVRDDLSSAAGKAKEANTAATVEARKTLAGVAGFGTGVAGAGVGLAIHNSRKNKQ